ncbi:MAG TPA: tripartite tricarboxylate transporter substrate binding protein [Firmicutes bacterium]|jgi:tripartite-type tricarboxylate transporter receptor subunit TctC|nr:tripartite tricarboxylate transporter substrate binding protein [Bacillota bacterium]
MRKVVKLVIGLVLVLSLSAALFAANYPTKPINFLIPFGIGGAADVSGRAIAAAAEEILGQPVVPQNKPGASGAIAYNEVRNAKPDGYTLVWNSTSIVTSTNAGTAPFEYDALEHICRTEVTDQPLVVRADAPWKNFEEFVAYARKNKVKIGDAGTATGTQLVAIAIAQAADLQVIHVPLGATRRIPSLLGGEVDAVVTPLPEIEAQLQSGQARVLCFPSDVAPKGYEDVPTLKELGYDVSLQIFRGISTTKGTPQEIVKKLEEAFKQATESERYQQLAKEFGYQPSFMGYEDFQKFLAEQNELVASAMKSVGMHKSQK